jgi:hypothetical protein
MRRTVASDRQASEGRKEMTTEQRLADLGYVEMDAGCWQLRLSREEQWLIESAYESYQLSEWRGSSWSKVAIYFDGDFLATSLEAIGAHTSPHPGAPVGERT